MIVVFKPKIKQQPCEHFHTMLNFFEKEMFNILRTWWKQDNLYGFTYSTCSLIVTIIQVKFVYVIYLCMCVYVFIYLFIYLFSQRTLC